MKLKYFKRVCLLTLTVVSTYSFAQAQPDVAEPMASDEDSVIVNNYTGYRHIGYGRQATRYITSSISTVYGNSIDKNFNLNLGNTLFGRLPGVHIGQANSEPGVAAPGFLVRGFNSFGDASDAPLFIIDGFISNGLGQANAFMQLVPEEIESISVLKDASATAVYGARAANGVILVTTKAGKNAPLKVNFTTRQGFNQARQLPKFLNSYDYARLYNEALTNDGLPIRYTDADLKAYQDGSDPYFHPNVNWYDEVLRPAAYASDYNLNLNGGDETVRYFVNLNIINSQGLYKAFGNEAEESSNSNYVRYNFRTNLEANLNKNLTAAFKIAGSVEQKENPFEYTTANVFTAIAGLPPNAFPVYNPNGSFGGSAAYTTGNPLANLLSTGFSRSNARTILSSLQFTHKLGMITQGLSASINISINNYFRTGSTKRKTYERFAITRGSAGDTLYGSVLGARSSLAGTEETLDQYRNMIAQAYLNYKRTFGKHGITAMAMFNRDEITLFGPAGDNTNPTGNSTDPYKHNNASGRVTYVYNDKYIGEFSGSYMASNIFPKGKRGGFFPAGSVGWIVSSESFLKKSKSINFLKLRGSYGLTGNDVIIPLGLSTRYSLYTQTYGGAGYIFGTSNTGVGGLSENILANPNITWEKEKSINVGLDATLFKHLDLSVDVFKRDRYDILVASNSLIPLYLGAITPSLNNGKTQNKGFEIMLRYNNKNRKNFRYFIEGNVSYAKGKIVFNAEALQLNTALYATGTALGQGFGYEAIGFFTQADIDARKTDPRSVPGFTTEIIKPGDIKYRDIGGPAGKPDGIIDANDRKAIGKPFTPNLIGGLHGGFQFKAFDLDFVFQGATGHSLNLSGNYFQAFQNNGQISPIALGRWTPETAATATYPRLSSRNNLNNYQFSTFYLRDAGFIKLRSAEIGYTLNEKFSNRLKVGTIRFFVNGTNLFSIDKIEYGDPESLTGYPVTRVILGGVKIKI